MNIILDFSACFKNCFHFMVHQTFIWSKREKERNGTSIPQWGELFEDISPTLQLSLATITNLSPKSLLHIRSWHFFLMRRNLKVHKEDSLKFFRQIWDYLDFSHTHEYSQILILLHCSHFILLPWNSVVETTRLGK